MRLWDKCRIVVAVCFKTWFILIYNWMIERLFMRAKSVASLVNAIAKLRCSKIFIKFHATGIFRFECEGLSHEIALLLLLDNSESIRFIWRGNRCFELTFSWFVLLSCELRRIQSLLGILNLRCWRHEFFTFVEIYWLSKCYNIR